MSVRLYIVRHGNTFAPGETVLRIGSRTDLPLVESGRAQARHLGRALSDVPFRRVLSSPLQRALETARIIMAENTHRPLCEIETDAFLTEIDYGPDEGQPEAAVRARLGVKALDRWESHNEPPPGWLVEPESRIAAFRRLADHAVAPDATNADASDATDAIDATNAALHGPFLLVTSNGVARFALTALIAPDMPGISGEAAPPGKLRTGAYGVIDIDAGGRGRLVAWDVRP